LTDKQVDELIASIRHASKIAAADPAGAVKEIKDLRASPSNKEADGPLKLMERVLGATGTAVAALQDQTLTPRERRSKWHDVRIRLEEDAAIESSTKKLDGAVRDEAGTWMTGFDLVFALDGFLAAEAPPWPPGKYAIKKPATGAGQALAAMTEATKNLVIAIVSFEARKWDEARLRADKAADGFGDAFIANMFGDARESAKALSDISAAVNNKTTILDAFDQVKPRTCAFARRFIVVDCVKNVPPHPWSPDGNGFDHDGKGLAAPNATIERNKLGIRERALDDLAGGKWLRVGSAESTIESRLKVQRDTGSVHYLVFDPAGKKVDARPWPHFALFGTDKTALLFTTSGTRPSQLEKAVSATEAHTPVSETLVFSFLLTADGWELHLAVNQKDLNAVSGKLRKDDVATFHATRLHVTQAAWVLRSPPILQK
jgi:hypothetical protein